MGACFQQGTVMKILKKIWDDIQQGENIDLYITVLAAILLAVLNIIGLASDKWLAPITLAVLALLAISNLGSRNKLEKILEQTTRPKYLLQEYPAELKNDITNSTELWMVGQNLARTTVNYLPVFEAKLSKGDKIKALVINPTGTANHFMTVRLNPGLIDDYQHGEKVKTTLSMLEKLRERYPEHLEIKTIEYPLPFGAFVINPSQPKKSILYVEQYGFKLIDDMPKMRLNKNDDGWYDVYWEQVKELWNHAEKWNPDF